jgi:hypothetical protein
MPVSVRVGDQITAVQSLRSTFTTQRDPKEREPVDYPYLHTWVVAHFVRLFVEFRASIQREPLIPFGAPLDFVPGTTEPAQSPSETVLRAPAGWD